MSDIAVRVENLGKRYRIGRRQESYGTLRDTMVNFARGALGRRRTAQGSERERDMIWALRDVSFEIKQGDAVGVIGRNGAGKSTLLKILTRITDPTEGYVELHGRPGALLEVGTGFHPELTGRENIYLNGAILGMRKVEIDRKFDEIVAFSEVEKFLDTPVKRYSSGMYVRLAFAVAAHLEPEILLVDEVLAVGDQQFQKKCLGKMGEVAGEGRTVFLVSHNVVAIRELCTKALLLTNGRLTFEGASENTIANYLSTTSANSGANPSSRSGVTVLQEFFGCGSRTALGVQLTPGAALVCGLEIQINSIPDQLWINVEIFSVDGIRLVHVRNDFDGMDLLLGLGIASIEVTFDDLPLLADSYTLRFRVVTDFNGQIGVEDSREFPLLISGVKPGQGKTQAFVAAKHHWRITQDSSSRDMAEHD
jgi:ABC-type polysaccharide/polyol phosphate transport system ATPase subunit